MSTTLKVECDIHVRRVGVGAPKSYGTGERPTAPPQGRVPRVARLLALAIKFDGLVRTGAVEDYAALARAGHVSRARLSQIMNLVLLAPDIQEAILFLPPVTAGRDPVTVGQLQSIVLAVDWRRQRKLWLTLLHQFHTLNS
jgi:hypothetical protein